MGIFDKFKAKNKAKDKDEKEELKKDRVSKVETEKKVEKKDIKPEVKPEVKSEKVKSEKKQEKAAAKPDKQAKIKGTSAQAYQVLVRPLITEKAAELGALNKYIFAVDPSMNKIEVKKAIRKIYEVDPVRINILNFSGKKVRYGRIQGKTKSWKKAVVTLKPGDKIEVYEGV